jgi:hypothetical protein
MINTQSFIASTLNVTNSQFMQGGDLEFNGTSNASIVNLGTISAKEGDVFLIAGQVENQGTVNADGQVGLAGGNNVLLQASGDDRVAVRVSSEDGRVTQSGLIEATTIELKTAGNNPYSLAINHDGISRATGAINKNGRVILSATNGASSATGTVNNSGVIDAGVAGNLGFYPDFTDTSKKPYDRQKECLCRREESIALSSNGVL